MRRVLAALLVLLTGLQPALLHAQPAGAANGQTPPSRTQAPAASTPQSALADQPDIEALGLSFDRIKRLLADRAPSDKKSPLKLNYYVEVVALAPRLQLFTPEDLAPGGIVPWGAPTHADIVRLFTPVAFSSPRMPVGTLVVLGIMKLAEWEAARVARYKAEEERRRNNEAERLRQKALEDSGLVVVKTPK